MYKKILIALLVVFAIGSVTYGQVSHPNWFRPSGSGLIPATPFDELGTSGNRWAKVYATAMDLSGAFTFGGTMAGDLDLNSNNLNNGGNISGTWTGGIISHEKGGIEADISAITTGGMLEGTGAGTMGILAAGAEDTVLTMQADGSFEWEAAAGGSYIRSHTKVVCTSTTLDTTNCDSTADGTADESEINTAIDAVETAGGGTVMLMDGTYNIAASITLKDDVSLIGQGNGTILKRTNNGIQTVDTGEAFQNIEIAHIFFDGNSQSSTAGIDISHASTGLYFHHNTIDNFGVFLAGGTNLSESLITNNNFIDIGTTAGNVVRVGPECVVANNYFEQASSSANAVVVVYSSNRIDVVGNNIKMNVSSSGPTGIELAGSADEATVTGNHIEGGKYGVNLSADGTYNISGNMFEQTDQEAIRIGSAISAQEAVTITGNTFQGCAGSAADTYSVIEVNSSTAGSVTIVGNTFGRAVGNFPKYLIDLNNADGLVVVGNSCHDNQWTAGNPAIFRGTGESLVFGNSFPDPVEEARYYQLYNDDGDAMAAGDVVVLQADANGNEITHTTTAGDPMVVGMAIETIANNTWGRIQILGKTTLLKADGTDDIAIGDRLSAFTSAGIAQKAATDEMVFAIALEAYTTDDSNGVIDALLVSPRLEP
jgi:hypothetical protein